MRNESIQEICYKLSNLLSEENYSKSSKNVEIILAEIRQYLNENINDKHKTYIEELLKVLSGFLHGNVSTEVLIFYFKKQYNLKNDFINKLISSISSLYINLNDKRSCLRLIKTPKVSVIVTTYNRVLFLEECIDSILEQDYSNIEIIVIDDASTDFTLELITNKYINIPNFKYMRQEMNVGPGYNRREAFKKYGDGEYIFFIDDDDFLIDKTYISKAIAFHLDHPEVAFVAANVFKYYTQYNKYELFRLELDTVVNNYEYFMNLEKKNYPKPASTLTTIFKRKSLIDMGILEMNMVNDVSIYLRALLVGDAGFIDLVAGVYRIHNDNITFNLSKDFIIKNIEEKILIKELAVSKFGYDEKKMNEWLNNNTYSTISYYLFNSGKSIKDFKYMYEWVKVNMPEIASKVRKGLFSRYIKNKILSIKFIKKTLGK